MEAKPDTKTNQKNYRFAEGLRMVLDPNLGTKGGGSKVVVGSLFCLLGPSRGQDGLKMLQKAPRQLPRQILAQFLSILAKSLIDFWLILNGFSLDFWCVGVLVCWFGGCLVV